MGLCDSRDGRSDPLESLLRERLEEGERHSDSRAGLLSRWRVVGLGCYPATRSVGLGCYPATGLAGLGRYPAACEVPGLGLLSRRAGLEGLQPRC